MTGQPVTGSGDAIWEDGEWVSWDYINGQIYEAEEEALLERMVALAREYHGFMDRHLPIWGEIGELYAARRFGIERHKPNAEGSDGICGDTFVEIKTITPAKKGNEVSVKRSGNFGALVVVKIDEDYRFDARVAVRKDLRIFNDDLYRISWDEMDSTERIGW